MDKDLTTHLSKFNLNIYNLFFNEWEFVTKNKKLRNALNISELFNWLDKLKEDEDLFIKNNNHIQNYIIQIKEKMHELVETFDLLINNIANMIMRGKSRNSIFKITNHYLNYGILSNTHDLLKDLKLMLSAAEGIKEYFLKFEGSTNIRRFYNHPVSQSKNIQIDNLITFIKYFYEILHDSISSLNMINEILHANLIKFQKVDKILYEHPRNLILLLNIFNEFDSKIIDILKETFNKNSLPLNEILSIELDNRNNKLDTILKLVEFSENTILIGKNGAGKTRFCKEIIKLNLMNNIIMCPANFLLKIDKERIAKNINFKVFTNTNINVLNEEMRNFYTLNSSNIFEFYVGRLIDSWKTDKTHFEKISKNFNEIFRNKIIKISDYDEIIAYDTLNCQEYDFNDLSDGEKKTLLIFSIFEFSHKNAILIFDEPECYLNPGLYDKIWNLILNDYSTKIIIVITHDSNLIMCLNNFSINLIKEINLPQIMNIKKIEDCSEKNILINKIFNYINENFSAYKYIFCCESKDDAEIYNKIFENKKFHFIPINKINEKSFGCNAIFQSINAINNLKNYFSINNGTKICGLIDKDYYDKEFEKEFKEKGIFMLNYSEIENFIFSDEINQIFIRNKSKYKDFLEQINIIENLDNNLENIIKNNKENFIENKSYKYFQLSVIYKDASNEIGNRVKDYHSYKNKLTENYEKELENKNYKFFLKETNIVKDKILTKNFRRIYMNEFKKLIETNEVFKEKKKKEIEEVFWTSFPKITWNIFGKTIEEIA